MPDPQVDVAAYYNNGMSWEEFLEHAGNNRDRMEAFYDEFDFDEETAVFYNGRTPLQVLAIVEDWCPDVVQNLAMLAKISDEVPGMELSIVRRDESSDLMQEYLTDGNERIPVIAFFDMTFRELGRWAGRCAAADEWILDVLLVDRSRDFSDMGESELLGFNDEYDERFRDSYARDTLEEWRHLLLDEDY